MPVFRMMPSGPLLHFCNILQKAADWTQTCSAWTGRHGLWSLFYNIRWWKWPLLPKEEADFVGALKHQDAGRSETQGVFSSISALKYNHLSALMILWEHAETSDKRKIDTPLQSACLLRKAPATCICWGKKSLPATGCFPWKKTIVTLSSPPIWRNPLESRSFYKDYC